MRLATAALLLWAVTTTRGLSTSLNCTHLNPNSTLLKRFGHCNVTIENGYVNAFCNLLIGLLQKQEYIRANMETVTIEQILVSEEPLGGEPQDGQIVCMSLRSIKIRKWESFTLEKTQQYDLILTPKDSAWAPFMSYSLLIFVRQMTIRSTFDVPPQAAVAVCNGTRADRTYNFEIRNFIDRDQYIDYEISNLNLSVDRHTQALEIDMDAVLNRYEGYYLSSPRFYLISSFFELWNTSSFRTEALNVTFADTVKNIPTYLFNDLANNPISHLLFYKCNFDNIRNRDIPPIKNLERLEFFQTPIQNVDPHVFKLNTDITHSSFIGTKLPGIPEAIFDLGRLDTFDMSDTKVARDTEFQYCPGNCQRNSTVKHLILSGTNLGSLPTRAFCGFPLLKTLELENCHITQLSGSPFECLENLSRLTMPSNKIRSLNGENVKGLKNLVSLNLSKNHIAEFEGGQIFSILASLRSVILFQNEIKDLLLGELEYVPVEQLNLAYNQISKWNPPLFTRMSKLETLLLEHNVISKLSEDMFHDIRHVKYVNLSWNLWDCSSCQLKNLRSLLDKYPSQCAKCFLCKEPDQLEGRFVLEAPWNEDDCGPPDYFRLYGVPALLSIMVASLIGYAAYRNRWYCIYALLYIKVAVKGRRRQAHTGRFLWDAFLAYHSSDAEWVRDELLPKLESAPMRFRLCVAERDFIPGVPITDNICRAITQSRVSLFVLSREFCHSRWCMFELSLAQHWLFENDRHDSVVFIRKNDVDVSEMSSKLAHFINSRTYVQRPPDGSSEALNNLFWLQLQAALET